MTPIAAENSAYIFSINTSPISIVAIFRDSDATFYVGSIAYRADVPKFFWSMV